MCSIGHFYRCAFILLQGLIAVSCSAPTTESVPSTTLSYTFTPSTAIKTRHDALNSARDQIDRLGLDATCTSDTFPSLTPPQRDWALAWCGLRTRRADIVLAHAPSALVYAENLGARRRQIELGLLIAIAQDMRSEPSHKTMARVQRILLDSQSFLTGARDDTFAGDLPYLLASANTRGLILRTHTSSPPLETRALLEIAWREYTSFSRGWSIPHVERLAGRDALERGEIAASFSFLERALQRERAVNNVPGIEETSLDIIAAAQAAGAGEVAASLENWLVARRGVEDVSRHLGGSPVSWSADGVLRALRAPTSRTRMLAELELARTHSARPPAQMLSTLQAMEDLSGFRADAWRIAFTVGQLMHERGFPHHARRYLQHAAREVERLLSHVNNEHHRLALERAARPLYLTLIHGWIGASTARQPDALVRKAHTLATRSKARGLRDLMAGRRPPRVSPEPITSFKGLDPLSMSQRLRAALKRWKGPSVSGNVAALRAPRLPRLARGSISIEYLVGQRSGYAFVWDGKTMRVRKIAGRRVLEPLLARFRPTLMKTRMTRAQQKEHKALANRLYVELLGPVEDLIVDAKSWVIAPDDLLFDLPFEALAKPSRTSSVRYLIQDVALSYVPSLEVLSMLQARPKPQGKGALLVGSPRLGQAGVELFTVGRGLPERGMFHLEALFPRLPWSVLELRAVRALLQRVPGVPVTLWTGARASEAALRAEDLTSYRYVHIATHGLSDAFTWRHRNATPSFFQPALLLSPNAPHNGVLELEEVLGLRTLARLAILSGCTTGRGWRALGEGAFGLAGALLVTGTQGVIASHWEVGDRSTGVLMVKLYQHLTAGKEPAQALQRAQRDMARTLAPYHWAGFRLIGM